MAFFSSFVLISWLCSLWSFCLAHSLTFSCILFVLSMYSGAASLAWYRFSKYWAMCSLLLSGCVIFSPSSFIVSYSGMWFDFRILCLAFQKDWDFDPPPPSFIMFFKCFFYFLFFLLFYYCPECFLCFYV